MSRIVLEKSFTATGPTATDIPLSGLFNFSADFTSGPGAGTVQLQRSFDKGLTWKTTDTASVDNEGVGEATGEGSIRWRLNCSAFTSGTIITRISQ